MVLRFFLGANSGEGFFSLYPQLCREEARRIFVIKSGPGSGKSTAMRTLAKALGDAQEEILCSSDPASLDGVVFPDLALLDGTAPHGTAPLGHHTKKGSICKALRRRKYYGSSTRHGTNRILLQDKLFEVRRNCSIKKIKFSEIGSFNGKIA